MKTFRAGVFTLASLLAAFVSSVPARADVRSLDRVQTLPRPPTPASFIYFGQDVAIDGGHIIVIAAYEGGQQALLYRRNNSDGQWRFRRALVTWTGTFAPASVAMRNGIAAVQISDQIWIFELSGGDYVLGTAAAPIRHHGGVAISGSSVLVGGDNCDYDAVIYQKNSAGSWAITGRLDDNQGECLTGFDKYAVELNYDYALLRSPNESVGRAWRRNGSALDWVPAGTLPVLPEEPMTSDGGYVLQGATAVGTNGSVWRRTGTSTWARQGSVISVDKDNGYGTTFRAAYRDGVLVTIESGRYEAFPHVYVESSPGHFDHLASMPFFDATSAEFLDISGRTVVATARDSSRQNVHVYTLPAPLRAPTPVVNDFEDRDVSDFTFSGGQFALATRGTNDVLAQNASTGLAIAFANDTDWTEYQRVEADITPTFAAGSWVGLVARYVDANNYYYLAVRDNNTYGIYKRVNGVDTLLYDGYFYNQQSPSFRAALRVVGNRIDASFSFQQGQTVVDNSLSHGRAGVATYFARADFDDAHVSGADEYTLFWREYGFGGNDSESGLDELSGNWNVIYVSDGEESYYDGLAQSDISGSAVAVIGTPVANQELYVRMRVDEFGASQTGAWAGLLARYVDARNHYYVTMRATGQIQIRKIVNGVITVLGSANFTPVPRQYYEVRFRLINDQLQLYLDGTLVASAHDRDLTIGKYGLATYRALARWDWLTVFQP